MWILGRRAIAPRLVVISTLVWLVAGCSGSGSSSMIPGTVGAAVDQGGTGNGAASAAASMAPAEAPDGLTGSAVGGGGGNPPSAPRDDLKIVYTGSLQLVVGDLQAALAKAKTAVLAAGGYVGASQESNDGDRSVATITYRIPAVRWDDTISGLRGLAAQVVAEQTQATEVGGQIVDIEARLRNLRASEASLQTIAAGTGKVSDLLQVEAQLTDVRGQIEQLDGQRAQLEDQVAYGTLVTTFGLEIVQVQETAKGWDPSTDVDGALATLIKAGQTLVSGAIWFGIVWLPVLAVLGVILLIVRRVLRRVAPAKPGGPVPGWDGQQPG
ncbi:MAG TPA: DUF4349 domain-containing protein [Candidatus Limnocylindrales bacterium]|jgi:hypothetical protein